MLRRKLLIVFGSLIATLIVLAVIGVLMLHGVLRRMDHISTEAVAIVDKTSKLNSLLTEIEISLYELQLGHTRYLDPLVEKLESFHVLVRQIGEHYATHESEIKLAYRELLDMYPQFEISVSSLATAQDEQFARQYNIEALATAIDLRRCAKDINTYARHHANREQVELVERFRWLVLGTALGCLVVINISILALLRAASMVLRPVDALVATSRQLANEKFDHRAELNGNDEFAELAGVYNSLAERIESADRRRMETMGQMAVTLNHELNNAIGIIDLQLRIISRQSKSDPKTESCLRAINENLQRMAGTVESLKHIRRIVLTDYIAGAKMLDLKRSIQQDPDEEAALSGQAGRADTQ